VGARRHHHLVVTVLITNRGGRSDSFRPPFCSPIIRLLAVAVFVGGSGACASPGPQATGMPAVATDPVDMAVADMIPAVFTAEQAGRGERVFSAVCSACHGANEFKGPIFSMTWMAEPVGYLFEHISTNMPEDRPGSLAPEEYAAVLAHFLRANGRTPGDAELPSDPDLLRRMRW
jgi:mono/diheme cytochrome c family protein